MENLGLKINLDQLFPQLNEATINLLYVSGSFLVASLLAFLASKLIRYLFQYRFQQHLYDKFKIHSVSRLKTVSALIENLLLYIIYFIYIYHILTLIGIPIGTLLAGAGIFGVAIGLGAKDLITDIINGFFIIFEGQFEVGNLVQIYNLSITGTILSTGLRTTKIRSISGEVFYIPNSDISIINNMSQLNRQIIIEIPLHPENNLHLFEENLKATSKILEENYKDLIVQSAKHVGLVKNKKNAFEYRIFISVKNEYYYELLSIFYQTYIENLQAADFKIITQPAVLPLN